MGVFAAIIGFILTLTAFTIMSEGNFLTALGITIAFTTFPYMIAAVLSGDSSDEDTFYGICGTTYLAAGLFLIYLTFKVQ